MIINKKRYKGIQTYKEKGQDSYLLIDFNQYIPGNKNRWGFGQVIKDNMSSIATITTDTDYLEKECYTVSWSKLPEKWQKVFIEYI